MEKKSCECIDESKSTLELLCLPVGFTLPPALTTRDIVTYDYKKSPGAQSSNSAPLKSQEQLSIESSI